MWRWLNREALNEFADVAVERIALEVTRDTRKFAPRDTGNLIRSYTYKVLPREGSKSVALVGTGVEYAVYQEYGTSRMPAQPHLGPALEKARRKYG